MFRAVKVIPILGALLLNKAFDHPLLADTKIPATEFIKHNSAKDIWVSIDSKVYDLTQFMQSHPGGIEPLLKYAGKDATTAFKKQHKESILALLPELALLGELHGDLNEQKTDEEAERAFYSANKPPLSSMFNVNDFEMAAKKILPRDIYTYFATGSDDEATLRESHLAYSRVFFRPRILQNVDVVELDTKIQGYQYSLPFYITAFAGQAQLHPEGECVLASVASRNNMMYIISRMATRSLEDIISSVGKDTPVWCQFSVNPYDPDLSKAWAEVERFDQIKGIFISTDSAAGGNREKDFKVRHDVANYALELNALAGADKTYPPTTWEDIKRFKKNTSKKLILKGVQRTEDVLKAAELGLDGVVISSHGGRQLDYSQPPLEILAETMPILRQQPYYSKEKFDVYIDGGVRRGTDIIKALCLGATGVGMGKGFAFPLAAYGEEGAQRLVDQLRAELVRDMRLLGVANIKDLDTTMVNTKGLYNRIGNYADSYFRNYDPLPAPRFPDSLD